MSTTIVVWEQMGVLHQTMGMDVLQQELILSCWDEKHLQVSDSLWQGMNDYGIQNGTVDDSWGKTFGESWLEYEPRENLDIIVYEPCNYVSNVAYYDTMLYSCSQLIDDFNLTKFNSENIFLQNYVMIFTLLPPGSAMLHASATRLGNMVDNMPITFTAINILQYSFMDIEYEPTLHTLDTNVNITHSLQSYVEVISRPVEDWRASLEYIQLQLPNQYLTFAAIILVSADVVFPKEIIDSIESLLPRFINPIDVDFLLERYMPKFRNLQIKKSSKEQIKLGNILISTMIKAFYAFYWQEEMIPGDHLMDEDKIFTAGVILNEVNNFADSITGNSYQSFSYPNQQVCGTTQPHSIWHRESSYLLIDLINLSKELRNIVMMNQTDGEDVQYGLFVCLIVNECIDLQNIETILHCVQRIPIINPSPPCEKYIQTINFMPCIDKCSFDIHGLVCLIDCVEQFTSIGFSSFYQ